MMPKQYLHQRIKAELIRRIEEGIYLVGETFPSTKELAAEFSTSSVTIDKALAGLVEMGYISRKARKGSMVNSREFWKSEKELSKKGTILYSLIMRDSPSPYFWKNTIKGIYDKVHSHGADIIPCYIDENLPKAVTALRELEQKGVRGVIFAPVSMQDEEEYHRFNRELLSVIRECRFPLVMIDRYLKGEKTNNVVSEDYEAAVYLTESLFSSGVKKPLCVTHLFNTAFEGRINGFMDTLRKQGFSKTEAEERVIDIAPDRILIDGTDSEYTGQVLNKAPKFDGIFSVNAINLYTVVNALRQKDRAPRTVESPDRLRFVNFDEVGILRIEGLVLSAIQESHKIGQLAAQILLELLPQWPDAIFHVVKGYKFKRYT